MPGIARQFEPQITRTHDQGRAETPIGNRAGDRAHEGGRAAGTQSPAGNSRRCDERPARRGRAQPAADPELAQAFYRLDHGSSDELNRATGYFSGDLKSSASHVQAHYSGPTN